MPDTTAVLDITQLSLTELLTTDDTVMDAMLRKVTSAAEQHPQKALCAFNSAV